MTNSGLPASTGNKVTFDGAGIDAAKLFTQQTTGTVYFSFLLNVTALGSLNTTGGYFTGLNEGTSTNFGATVWARSDGTGYDIGINPRTTAANTAWSTGTTSLNSTLFVVISYQLVSGTTNDIVKLWINPTTGGTEPSATLSATNTGADLVNLNRIFLRQDATTATPFIEMDELRIGTTWADVTPVGTISAPTTQASNLVFSNLAPTGMTVGWTNGNGAKRIVIMNTSNSFTDPLDGADPTANTVYSGSGEQVVYNGAGNTVGVTGLSGSTTYWYRVYEYNGTGATTKYLTSTATDNPLSQATTAGPNIWCHMLTLGQPVATKFLGDKLNASGTWYVNFEIGQVSWDQSDAGIGKSNTDPSAWTWQIANWYADGTFPNKQVQADFGNFQLTSTGSWYINGRAKNAASDPYSYANSTDWQNNATFAPTEYITVDALTDPASNSATAISMSQIDLAWTADATPHNVMIVRKKSAESWTEPTQGNAYIVGGNIGSGVVVFNGVGTSYSNTGLIPGTSYDYKFYSENNSYYSNGIVSSASTLPCPVSALPFVEDFEYTPATTLSSNCWTVHSTGANPITVSTSTITYPGYLSSGVGNEISLLTGTGEDVNRTFTAQTSGIVYVSFIVNVSSATTSGDYFINLGQTIIGTTFRGRIYVKSDASNNLAFGIAQSTSSANYTAFSYALNTTYLVVLKFDIVSGAANDVAAIYIDPLLNDIEPSIGWIANTDAAGTDLTEVGSVAVRQGGASSDPALKLDGIRISTTWSDIVGLPLAEPTNHATSFAAGTTTATSIPLTWTDDVIGVVLPQNYLVKAAVSPNWPAAPQDGTPETNSLLVQNVAYGTEAITFTGLTQGISYNFNIWPYNNSGVAIDYKTNETVPSLSVSTLPTGYYQSVGTGNWSNLATWQYSVDGIAWATPTVEPASTDNVTVKNPHFVTVDGGSLKTCLDLTIQLGGLMTIGNTSSLTVTGTFFNSSASALYLASDASGSASLIQNTPNLPATVDRYMTGGSWHLMSAPVAGQSIPAFVTNLSTDLAFTDPKYGLAPYNSATPKWDHYTSSNVAGAGNFSVAKGYEILLTANATPRFTGTLATGINYFDIVESPLPGNAWNLIGNPFSSAIKGADAAFSNDFLNPNKEQLASGYEALYVWNGASYTIYNFTSGVNYIAVGQGFFVKSKTGGGTVEFKPAMRNHNNVAFYKNAASPWPSINLQAKIADNERKTEVFFIPGSTKGIDAGYDAGMFDGGSSANTVYTRLDGSDINFAIQSLPDNNYENTVIPVGINAAAGTSITFSAETMNIPSDVKVYLHDVVTNTYTQLNEPGSLYSVLLASASSGIGRFYLLTSKQTMGTPESKDDLYSIITVPSESKIRIIGNFAKGTQVAVYSLDGKVLYSGRLNNIAENEIRFAPAVSGIYLLRIQSGTSVINRKISWMY